MVFDKNFVKAFIFYDILRKHLVLTGTEKIQRKTNKEYAQIMYERFNNIITRIHENYETFPCISRETLEEQQRIILVYNKMMKLSSENALCLIQTHYGNKKITKNNFFKTLGKIFTKLIS
jgi:FPC/CPF motif-containing protein YcgG